MRSLNFRLAAAFVLTLSLGLGALAQNKGRGFDPSRMNSTAAACTDFYEFANGNWLKTTEIPAAFASWGSFNILAENNRKMLLTILEESSKNKAAKRGTNEQKIGDFYATCVDEAKREAEGVKPLLPELQRIEKIKDIKDVQAQIAHMHRMGVPALFGFGALADLKNSSQVIGFAGQGGLSLPTNEYYTNTDDKSKLLREQFVQHMTRMFELLGDAPATAAANAATVLAFQTRLAQNSRNPVQLRDFSTQYNKMGMKQLAELTPGFSWADYFAALGVARDMEINVAHPRGTARLLEAVQQDDLRAAQGADARLLVGRLLQGPRPGPRHRNQRRPPRVLPGR